MPNTTQQPWNTAWGWIVEDTTTTADTINSTSYETFSDLTVSFTAVPGRKYKYCLTIPTVYCTSYTAGYFTYIKIVIDRTTDADVVHERRSTFHGVVNAGNAVTLTGTFTCPTAGTTTITPSWKIQGTNTSSWLADADAALWVEDIGPA